MRDRRLFSTNAIIGVYLGLMRGDRG